MLQIGWNLPFDLKTAQHFLCICASFENFDGDSLVKLSVSALGEINCAHTTTSELLHNGIGAEPLAHAAAFVFSETCARELCEFLEHATIMRQQLLGIAKQGRIVATRAPEKSCASFERRLLQRICEDLFQTPPPLWIRLDLSCG